MVTMDDISNAIILLVRVGAVARFVYCLVRLTAAEEQAAQYKKRARIIVTVRCHIFFSQRDKTRVLRCKDKNSAFLQQFINSHKKWFNIRNIHNCHIRNCFRKGSISF